MIRLFFIIVFLSAYAAGSQVLIPTAETAFETQHNFNPAVIRQKGIRKITFEIIDKKDFQVAEDKSLTETYEFTSEGLLSRHYYTTIKRTLEKQITTITRRGKPAVRTVSDYVYDTISTSYFYNNNQLVLKRYHDGGSYYEARYYRYNNDGLLTKELRYKETNNSPDKSVFILGNQVLLSEDSFQYQKFSSGQIKCTYLNNENRPYKERIINPDSIGRPKHIFESYTAASWIMQEQKFTYTGSHLLSAQFEGNAGNKVSIKNLYEYDEKEELYGEKHYKNDVLIKEVSYVADKINGLLNSFVIRDPVNKTMRIVKLRYDLGMVGKSNGKRM